MKSRLALLIGFGILALTFAPPALAAAPQPLSPGNDAIFLADGNPIGFSATVAPTPPATNPGRLDFYISKDPTPDTSGFLTNFVYRIQSGPPDANGVYSGASDSGMLAKPGDYYWQPVNPDSTTCAAVPECNGPIQRFVISPLPAAAVTNANQVETFFKKKPRHRTRKRKVKFAFTSNVEGAHFQCLFASGWKKCRSPHVFRHLKPGRYQFSVRAVVNGIADPDPKTWIFRVLRRHRHSR